MKQDYKDLLYISAVVIAYTAFIGIIFFRQGQKYEQRQFLKALVSVKDSTVHHTAPVSSVERIVGQIKIPVSALFSNEESTGNTSKTSKSSEIHRKPASSSMNPAKIAKTSPKSKIPATGGQPLMPFLPDSITLPITQCVYHDSDYTAYVSGYRPHLDSISVRLRTVTVRQTVTRRQPLKLGITAGAGYGVLSRRPDIFVGIGLTWNPFR